MKLTIDTKSFTQAVDWATKSFDAKDSVAYVALVANSNGDSYLFHANLSSFMKSSFQTLDVEFDGDKDSVSIALEGRFLQRLSRGLSSVSGPMEILHEKTKDGESVQVKTSNGTFSVPVLKAVIPNEPEVIELGEFDNQDYFSSLQRLAKLCDSENADFLPVLGAVDIKLDTEIKKIVMMATDRYVLGEIVVDFEPATSKEAEKYISENDHILLPVENAVMINSSKDGSSATMVYETKGKKFGYRFADGKIALFSLKKGDPLPYKKLKEKSAQNNNNSLSLETVKFKKSLDTIANIAFDEDSIFLNVNSDELIVSDSTSNNKMTVETSEIEVDADYNVKFLRSIINKAFAPISTKQMNVKWANEKSTFIFEAVLDDGTVADNVFVFVIPSE